MLICAYKRAIDFAQPVPMISRFEPTSANSWTIRLRLVLSRVRLVYFDLNFESNQINIAPQLVSSLIRA